MPGIRTTRPGPLTFQKRPSWKTTPRWYSRRMRSDETASARMMTNNTSGLMNPISRSLERRDTRQHAVHRNNADLLTAQDRYCRAHLPGLAADARPAGSGLSRIIDHLTFGADQRSDPAHDRRAAR